VKSEIANCVINDIKHNPSGDHLAPNMTPVPECPAGLPFAPLKLKLATLNH
jgi:hypothetical protein